MKRHSWSGLVLASLAIACTNAGERLVAPSLPNGGIQALVFFDRDDSHSFTNLDTVFAGGRVALLAPGGTDTLRVGVTNASGLVTFDALPVGTYRVVVDRHALSDTVGVIAGDTGIIRITADTGFVGRIVRFGYTEVTLAAARALPAGKRVMVRAIVTSPLQAFRDSSAFLIDSSGALRSTGSRPRVGGGNNLGDSVVVLGTTGKRSGQGVLLDGLFIGTLTSGVSPLPRITSVVDAINAKGGTLDAALIQITNFVVRDTAVSGTDFAVRIADPADTSVKVTMLIDQVLNTPHTPFAPGRTGSVKGVLQPVGDGTWVLKPRTLFDIVLN